MGLLMLDRLHTIQQFGKDIICLKIEIHGFAHVGQTAHDSTIWKGHHLPQDRDTWVTCGGDGVASIWRYEYPSKRVVDGRGVAGQIHQRCYQKISSQPVNSWTWHPEKKGLAACTTLDQKVNVIFVTKL